MRPSSHSCRSQSTARPGGGSEPSASCSQGRQRLSSFYRAGAPPSRKTDENVRPDHHGGRSRSAGRGTDAARGDTARDRRRRQDVLVHAHPQRRARTRLRPQARAATCPPLNPYADRSASGQSAPHNHRPNHLPRRSRRPQYPRLPPFHLRLANHRQTAGQIRRLRASDPLQAASRFSDQVQHRDVLVKMPRPATALPLLPRPPAAQRLERPQDEARPILPRPFSCPGAFEKQIARVVVAGGVKGGARSSRMTRRRLPYPPG
jgi:hypothetical protein